MKGRFDSNVSIGKLEGQKSVCSGYLKKKKYIFISREIKLHQHSYFKGLNMFLVYINMSIFRFSLSKDFHLYF